MAITWLNVIVTFWFAVVNACVGVYVIISVWGKEKSLSTPLLLVIGCNMFLYLGYYMTRKFGEIILRIVEKDHRSFVIEKIGEIHDNPAAAEEEDEETAEQQGSLAFLLGSRSGVHAVPVSPAWR